MFSLFSRNKSGKKLEVVKTEAEKQLAAEAAAYMFLLKVLKPHDKQEIMLFSTFQEDNYEQEITGRLNLALTEQLKARLELETQLQKNLKSYEEEQLLMLQQLEKYQLQMLDLQQEYKEVQEEQPGSKQEENLKQLLELIQQQMELVQQQMQIIEQRSSKLLVNRQETKLQLETLEKGKKADALRLKKLKKADKEKESAQAANKAQEKREEKIAIQEIEANARQKATEKTSICEDLAYPRRDNRQTVYGITRLST